MFTTEYGKFDGKSWEDFCQRCFKLKYEIERYQELPPITKGDLGIEGFTESGKAFQCYCPDFDITSSDLYKKQRDKINRDLNKLEKNCGELENYFNGHKLQNWIFVTPDYRNKEIVSYCKKKANELKAKNLNLLSPNFDVLIYNSGFFTKEAPLILESIKKEIDLIPENDFFDLDLVQWRNQNINLTDNAIRKFEKVVPTGKANRQEKINTIVTKAVLNYLYGNEVLEKWRRLFPEKYEKFIRVIGSFEEELAEEQILFEGGNQELFKKVKTELHQIIEREFPSLAYAMRNTIRDRIVYGWILECPLDFE